MWARRNCGRDFIEGLADGRVTFDILDYDSFYSYELSPYTRDDKALSGTILAFRQETNGEQDMPWTKHDGKGEKKDQFEMVFNGVGQIEFAPRFAAIECLMSASVGVYISHDKSLRVTSDSLLKCAAWGRDIF